MDCFQLDIDVGHVFHLIIMNNKLLAIIVILMLILLFLAVTLPANLESEPHIKQGILTNVSISESGIITLLFSDGEEIHVIEDNLQDSQEMYEYMSGWIGLEIIVGYSYDYYVMAYEIDSVSGV